MNILYSVSVKRPRLKCFKGWNKAIVDYSELWSWPQWCSSISKITQVWVSLMLGSWSQIQFILIQGEWTGLHFTLSPVHILWWSPLIYLVIFWLSMNGKWALELVKWVWVMMPTSFLPSDLPFVLLSFIHIFIESMYYFPGSMLRH